MALNIEDLSSISGSANVQVSFSKSLNEISYESYEVKEYEGDALIKADATISNEIISFTDADCSSHRFYVFKFYDADGTDTGVNLWNNGLYPTKIKFTFSDTTYKEYNVTKITGPGETGGEAGGGTGGETVTVTLVDGLDNSTVATTTVPKNSSIVGWLGSVGGPTHDGYNSVGYRCSEGAGDINNVTGNMTVTIIYTKIEESILHTSVNGDGDISISIEKLADIISDSATVQVYFSKELSTVNYESFDVYEFGTGSSESGQKTNASISSNIITFTDENCSTHSSYRFRFYDGDGNKLGNTQWHAGLYPTKIRFDFADTTHKEYNITTS